MAIRIGINGFGRIGRTVLRAALKRSDIEIAAINDLGAPDVMVHLLKYDSVHGAFPEPVALEGGHLAVGKRKIRLASTRDPREIGWGKDGVSVVFESTGVMTERAKAAVHLEGGAKKVIISAPASDADLTVVMGINHAAYDAGKHHVLSNASCTTNCLAPVAKVLLDRFGIRRGLMTTVHSYTNDQQVLDAPHKDLRRARAAALSQIPTTTGAAKAVGLVLPELKGKLDGLAIRVPTPNVSCVDLVCELEREADVAAVNGALKEAALGALKGILAYSEEPLVSSDFNGNPHSSIVDALSTFAIDKKLVKVLAWYDNETGFSTRMLDLAALIGKGL